MTFRVAAREQARSCRALGSPFTARLLELCADRLTPGTAIADRLLSWKGDLGPAGQSVPLRLAGSLHGLVLAGLAPDLADCYPPHPFDGNRLWQAVETIVDEPAQRLDGWLDRPPQTNETGRSAVLIAAAHWLWHQFELPIELSELGASAGLNLHWDRYALSLPDLRLGPADAVLSLTPEWRGDLPPVGAPRVTGRRGVDLTPLDPSDPEQALRLLAYIWPDQPARLTRTRAAIATADTTIDRGDAADWLETRMHRPIPNRIHLVYHTVAWQYFPSDVQARAEKTIRAAGAAATPSAPVAWLGMEADGGEPGAAITLKLWPGGERVSLGRADFHGRWVDWRATI